MRRLIPALAVLLLLTPAAAKPAAKLEAGYLRLVHMTDGLRSVAPKRDLKRLPQTDIFKTAAKAGVDVRKPDNPLIAHTYNDKHVLFYVFYKVSEGIVSDRPYIIQRIKKTIRNWTSEDEPPEEIVTYQVETFKTLAGALKRADQHFGSFGLRTLHKREIVKEYEIGIGEIPGEAEGLSWPYEARALYKLNQPYQAEVGLHDEVVFKESLTWSLTVAFDRDGYRISAPELGIDLPRSAPAPERGQARLNPRSAKLMLEAGQVAPKLAFGDAGEQALRKLGNTVRVDRFENGTANHVLDTELTVHIAKDGLVRSIVTHAPFAGRTTEGITHGSTRVDVMRAHGVPAGQLTDAKVWRYAGIQFTFDGFHRVTRIGLSRRPDS